LVPIQNEILAFWVHPLEVPNEEAQTMKRRKTMTIKQTILSALILTSTLLFGACAEEENACPEAYWECQAALDECILYCDTDWHPGDEEYCHYVCSYLDGMCEAVVQYCTAPNYADGSWWKREYDIMSGYQGEHSWED